jgi:hypothetical protein
MSDDVIARARAVIAEASPVRWTSAPDGYVVRDGGHTLAIADTFGCVRNARAIVLSRNTIEALLDVLGAVMGSDSCSLCGRTSEDWRTRGHRCEAALAMDALRAELERIGR